jgi:hypothetical protein
MVGSITRAASYSSSPDTMGPSPALPCSPSRSSSGVRSVARWVDVFFARGDSAQTEGGSPAITQACCGTAPAATAILLLLDLRFCGRSIRSSGRRTNLC